MVRTGQNNGEAQLEKEQKKRAIYIEDALILLSVAALFGLGVFFRDRIWAQLLLTGVLGVMVVVFFRRFRRLKSLLKNR